MDKVRKSLTRDERRVRQVVAELPFIMIELPRPYTLELLANLARISERRVERALRNLQLLTILSDDPSQALERAEALAALVWKVRDI